MTIYKTYDIRGIYQTELKLSEVYNIGEVLSYTLDVNNVLIGYDARIGSHDIYNVLSYALTSKGIKVDTIGLCTTPKLYFSSIANHYDIGIMITASHNPKEFVGIKIIDKDGRQQTYDSLYKKIEERIDLLDNKPIDIVEIKKIVADRIEKVNYNKIYFRKLLKSLNPTKKKEFNIVADFGNGVGNITFEKLIYLINTKCLMHLKPTLLYENPNGSFPNHEANPAKYETLKELQKTVLEQKADFGIAFDGDADRIAIVDNNGEILALDDLAKILIDYELTYKNHSNKNIYYDLRFSKTLSTEIIKRNGIPNLLRVGNPFYKDALIDNGGILGLELSGHIMYKEHFAVDDPLFVLVRLLSYLSLKNKPISKIRKEFSHLKKSQEININIKNTKKVLNQIKEKYKNQEIKEIDGISVYLDQNTWFNVRRSNTEDLIRIVIESKSQDKNKEIESDIRKIIRKLED